MSSWNKQTNIQGPAGANSTVAGPQGPAGPTAVSTDDENASRLGSDGLIYTPAASGGGNFVKIPGDTMTGALNINAGSTTKNLITEGDILISSVTVGNGDQPSLGNTIVGEKALLNCTGNDNTAIGYEALHFTTNGHLSTAVGYQALYSNIDGGSNNAFGHSALYNNKTGSANTAAGSKALYGNQAGNDNSAFGHLALSHTTSSYNTGVGCNALFWNSGGSSNTAIGFNALTSNSYGTGNTAAGSSSLYNNTTGSSNNAYGGGCLRKNLTGSSNNAYGRFALYNNSTGVGNTGFGEETLYSNIAGNNNVAVGIGALLNGTGNDNICIGGRADPVFNITVEDNHIVMGGASASNAYIKVAWTVVSDERDKMNFTPVPHGLEFVNALKPTAFQFKKSRDTDEPNGPVRYGFKAQDILALEGATGVIIENKDPEILRYNGESLVPVLVNALNELTSIVKNLQGEVTALSGT